MRYKNINIVEPLNDPLTLPYLAFASFCQTTMKLYYHISIRKATYSPVIRYIQHVTNILQNFVNKKSRNVEQDGVSKLKPIRDLVTSNSRKKENLKSVNIIEIGPKLKVSFMVIMQLMMQLLLFVSLLQNIMLKLLHTFKLTFHSLII